MIQKVPLLETEHKDLKICRFFPVFQDDFWYTEHYIAKELNREGIRTTFVTSNRYRKSWSNYISRYHPAGYYNYEHYDVVRLNALFPFEQIIFINWYKLYKLLFKNGNSVIHIYGYGSIGTLQVFILSLFSGKNRPSLLISDHSSPVNSAREGKISDMFYYILRIMLNLFKDRYNYIITFSNVGVQILSSRFKIPKEKFRVIPLGYDQDTYYYRSGIKNTDPKFIIGFAGKINPLKRLDFLISCLGQKEFRNKVRLIIVGMTVDSYCNSLRSLADKTGLETDFRPFSDKNTLALFYNYIDLAVFPGDISITTIEANGCGTPVLIYESIEGLSERVTDGRGLLFKNDFEFTEQIRSYIRMYEKDEIDNARIEEATKIKYSWRVIKELYKDIYRKCMDNES